MRRAVAEGAKGSGTGSRLRGNRAWSLLRVGIRVTTGLE